jgi:hypothetical protein
MLLLARQIRDVVVMMVGDMKYVLDIVLASWPSKLAREKQRQVSLKYNNPTLLLHTDPHPIYTWWPRDNLLGREEKLHDDF